MPIEIILNGYYRSGTTYFWEILKTYYNNHIVFYEPLNPRLAFYIRNYQRSSHKDTLHQKEIWKDYLRFDEDKRNELFLKHPKLYDKDCFNLKTLTDYLDFFHSQNEPIILQANRLHCFLDLIAQKYVAKVIHIIRHPLDVYNSILSSYVNMGINKPYIKFLKIFLKYLIIRNYYSIKDEFDWIRRYLGYPANWNNLLHLRLNPFAFRQKIILNWVVFNYMAIKSIERSGGVILFYELCGDSKKMEEMLQSYLGIESFDFASFIPRNIFNFDEREVKRLLIDIKILDLQKEFNYILEYAAGFNLDYLKPKRPTI